MKPNMTPTTQNRPSVEWNLILCTPPPILHPSSPLQTPVNHANAHLSPQNGSNCRCQIPIAASPLPLPFKILTPHHLRSELNPSPR